jgi:hypothetical protein
MGIDSYPWVARWVARLADMRAHLSQEKNYTAQGQQEPILTRSILDSANLLEANGANYWKEGWPIYYLYVLAPGKYTMLACWAVKAERIECALTLYNRKQASRLAELL